MDNITTKDKTNKYIIWLNNLSTREYIILTSILDPELFEVVDDDITIEKLEKLHYLEGPDLIIYDDNSKLNPILNDQLSSIKCRCCKVGLTRKDIFDDVLLLNNEEIEFDKMYGDKFVTTKCTNLEYTLNKIIEICQLSEFSKIQIFAKEEARKILYEENPSLKSKGDIEFLTNKRIVLKIARKLNDFISIKDNYTAGHCDRVAKYAELLGKNIGLDIVELLDLKLSAYLHDIGKIALPDAVITKTTRLTDTEYEIMKKHVELGSKIVPTELGELGKVIRSHHEKYDGTGYPDGLKGDEIPYYAQILAIADSFDAMTSQRPYNHVKSANEALMDLKKHTMEYGVDGGLGIWYNPELTDLFIYAISNDKLIMDELNNKKLEADKMEELAKNKNDEKENIDKSYQYKRG